MQQAHPTSPQVALRPLESEDIGAVFALQQDHEAAVMAGVPGEFVDEPTFRGRMETVIETYRDAPRLFAVLADDEFAGYLGCLQSAGRHWFLNYWLARPYWGKGIASAAVGAFIDNLPDDLKGLPLYAQVADGNPASERVLEKHGFKAYGRSEFQSAALGKRVPQTLFRRTP